MGRARSAQAALEAEVARLDTRRQTYLGRTHVVNERIYTLTQERDRLDAAVSDINDQIGARMTALQALDPKAE